MSKASNQTKGEWVEAIAKRAGMDAGRVDSLLAAHHISPTPVLPTPRRLLLLEIEFSGEKDISGAGEAFRFHWGGLKQGLWAVLLGQESER